MKRVSDDAAVRVARVRIGNGLVATRRHRAGDTVLRIRGRIRGYQYLLDHPGMIQDNAFRYGPVTYLCPEGESGDYLNHSCRPNARIEKRGRSLFVVAISVIPRGHEVYFDYSTILAGDDIWSMRCRCGTKSCRGRIRRYTTFPKAMIARYLSEGLIPLYIAQMPE